MIGHYHVICAFSIRIHIKFCDIFGKILIFEVVRGELDDCVWRPNLELTSVDGPWPVRIEHIERLPQIRLHFLRQLQPRTILLLCLLFRLQKVLSCFYHRFYKCKQYRIPNSKINFSMVILIASSRTWPQ